MKVLHCSLCGQQLEVVGQAPLETLAEHVSDPNGIVPYRDNYECLNKQCRGYKNLHWNEYGEMYIRDYDALSRNDYLRSIGAVVIEDHSPSEYGQPRDATMLLGIAEYSDLESYEWIREATLDEVEVEIEKVVTDRPDITELLEDHRGRKYKWVTVLRTAPGHIWRQAFGHLRLLHFKCVG